MYYWSKKDNDVAIKEQGEGMNISLDFVHFCHENQDMWVNFTKMVVFSNTCAYKISPTVEFWDDDYSGTRWILQVPGGIIFQDTKNQVLLEEKLTKMYETHLIESVLLKENNQVFEDKLKQME